MWVGKIAIIMTCFSIGVSWGMYEMSTMYTLPGSNNSWTETHLKAMAGNFSSLVEINNGQNPNPALIFGDFLTGATVLFNALAVVGNSALGGGLSSVLQGIPGMDNTVIFLIQIVYGVSEVLLWVYIISNRSL